MNADKASLGVVLSLGLATGLWGIHWGLPGAHRLRAFPDTLPMTPAVAQKFTDSWHELREGMLQARRELSISESSPEVQGVMEIPPGWSFPPAPLVNSYRSLLLQAENPDEKKSFTILARMRPWKLEFEPFYVQYGGAFIYPLGIFLKILEWVGAVHLTPDISHYLLNPDDMRGLYLAGRFFILIFHLGSLWMLHEMGRSLGGWPVGLCAAALFALCPIIVSQAHVLKPHSYAVFWALAAALGSFKALNSGRKEDYLLSGACGGLAMGAAMTLAFFIVLPALAWLDRRWRRKASGREKNFAALGVAAAIAACALTNPYLLFSYRDFIWETQVRVPPSLSLRFSGLLTVMPRILVEGMGAALAALAALGIFFALLGKQSQARVATWILGGCGALLWLRFGMGEATPYILRLYLPLLGISCLLAAHFLWKLPQPVRALLLGAALLDSGLRTAVCLENMRRDDTPASTRALAADWIERHVPLAASVGLARYPEPAHTPPFRYDRYRLIIFERPQLLDKKGKYPAYIVLDEMNRAELDLWLEKKYALAAGFQPFGAGWIKPLQDASFANEAQYIYRLKTRI